MSYNYSDLLKRRMPYIGRRDKYFIANGSSGAGSINSSPNWNLLFGPVYTSPNFIKKETLSIEINNTTYPLTMDMHRIRQTGIFAGEVSFFGIKLSLFDFTLTDESRIIRHIAIKNLSDQPKEFSINAKIKPLVKISKMKDNHLELIANEKEEVFCWTTCGINNWEDRTAKIYFDTESKLSKDEENEYCIETKPLKINSKEIFTTSLIHDVSFTKDQKVPSSLNIEKAIKNHIDYWENWFLEGSNFDYPNERIRNIIEGSLISIKMSQSNDGGFMACTHSYCFSYFRDSHGGLRALASAGHTKELKDFILWSHKKYLKHGHIMNSAAMGGDVLQNLSSTKENLASESTAYYILLIRYYYNLTKDSTLLKEIESSMKFAVDIQIKYAKKHGYNMIFNGDETEQYVCFLDHEMYGSLQSWNKDSFSFASMTGACVSIQFYIEWLKNNNRDKEISYYESELKAFREHIDKYYWDESLKLHQWCILEDNNFSSHLVTNFNLMPMWMGAKLNHNREIDNVLSIVKYLNDFSGFLPIAPGYNEGFSGHTLGYLLYDLSKIDHKLKEQIFNTLISNKLVDAHGTYSEFYGPSGVSNTHNHNIFSTGINISAILYYLFQIDF